MNKLEPEDIEWAFKSSMAFTTYHHSLYRNEQFCIQMEGITNVTQNGFGKSKKYFYMDGQKKEYTDLQELCNDWNEIKNFDDPNNEIVWVKKIVPTIKLNENKDMP